MENASGREGMTLFLGGDCGRQRTRRDTNTNSYMPLTPGCQIPDVSPRTEISSWPAAASVSNTANIAASTSGPVSVRRSSRIRIRRRTAGGLSGRPVRACPGWLVGARPGR